MNGTAIERWDTLELAFEAEGTYDNPFADVELSARFVAEDGTEIPVDGFYDGGSTWRVRFMPTELGTWRFETTSSDAGPTGQTGALVCLAPSKPYLHGPLQADGHHFKHVDGTRRYLFSTRLSCQFASPDLWPPVIEFLRENYLERVFLIMGGRYGTVRELYKVDGDDIDFSRYNIGKLQAIDHFIVCPAGGGYSCGTLPLLLQRRGSGQNDPG